MIDRETFRKQIKTNPQRMFSHLTPEEEATLREIANEEGYEIEIGEMMVFKRGSTQHPLILRKREP
jgi:hypothetical protein